MLRAHEIVRHVFTGSSTLTAVITLMAAATPVFAQCQYSVEIITLPPCQPFDEPPDVNVNGLNSSGMVCGDHEICLESPHEAFYWTAETGVVTIPRPPESEGAWAWDINDAGLVVGTIDYPFIPDFGPLRGFVYDGQELTIIEHPDGNNTGHNTQAYAINSNNQIVGQWGNTSFGPFPMAYVWEDDRFVNLHPFLDGSRSCAEGINEHGDICGWMGESVNARRAFILTAEREVLEFGKEPGWVTHDGISINDQKHVTGRGVYDNDGNGEGQLRSFFWNGQTKIHLGELPGSTKTFATDINNNDIVVGYCLIPEKGFRGFIWQNNIIYNLNNLVDSPAIQVIKVVTGISDNGTIVGEAINSSEGDGVGVRLTPCSGPIGDFNLDCQVNGEDLGVLLGQWNEQGEADLNRDGTVNGDDLNILFSNWS